MNGCIAPEMRQLLFTVAAKYHPIKSKLRRDRPRLLIEIISYYGDFYQ
jgi:hypothetical protein